MSIFFNIGRNPNPDYVQIDCEFIALKNLKGIISKKIGVAENDMRVKHVITNIQYAPYEYIKKGSSVSIEIKIKNYIDEPIKFHQIVSNQKLESMMGDCRFYIAKSSNQDNIQKARDCSVWATTYPNQVNNKTPRISLEQRFNVLNTSYQLKGLARMESQPDKIPDKTIWSGVGNIRLGGNFKIRWIRKKPLSLTTIQKKLGVEAKDEMLKATDGYEPDGQIAKKVALLFELPLQPYYKLQDLSEIKKQQKLQKLYTGEARNSSFINAHLASLMLKNIQESPNIDQLGIVQSHFQIPKTEHKNNKSKEKQKQKEKEKQKVRENQKENKKYKKKIKKDKKRRRKSYSSSSSNSSSNSRSHGRSRSRGARSQSSSSSSSSSSSFSYRHAKRQKVSTTQRTNKL